MNQRLAVGVSNLLSGRLEAVIGQSAARLNFFGRESSVESVVKAESACWLCRMAPTAVLTQRFFFT